MPTRTLAGLLTIAAVGGFLTMCAAPARAQRQDAATAQVETDPHAQHGAIEAMTGDQHQHGAGNAHMKLTAARPLTDADQRRADAIVEALRSALDKYKDSNV